MIFLKLLFIILSIVASEGVAQYCIKKSKGKDCSHFFILGILAYISVCFFLYQSYDYDTMGVINTLWSALSIITITVIGAYFYHESLKTEDYIGVLFVITGIFFIYGIGH